MWPYVIAGAFAMSAIFFVVGVAVLSAPSSDDYVMIEVTYTEESFQRYSNSRIGNGRPGPRRSIGPAQRAVDDVGRELIVSGASREVGSTDVVWTVPGSDTARLDRPTGGGTAWFLGAIVGLLAAPVGAFGGAIVGLIVRGIRRDGVAGSQPV